MIAVLVLLWTFLAGVAWSHDLGPGDVLISPHGGFIETDTYLIRSDVIPAWQVAQDLGHFRRNLWPGLDYVAFSLQEKATGQAKTTLIPLDGGIEPFYGLRGTGVLR